MWYPVDRELAVSFCIDPNADAEWRRRYDTFARVVLAPIPEEQQPARATMTENPEQAVIDQIDALVNESLAHGPTDDYERDYQERCDLCAAEWHGLAHEYNGCPGAHATPEQREEYLHKPHMTREWPYVRRVVQGAPYYTYYEAFSETQSGTTEYTLADLAAMNESLWLTRTYEDTPTFDAPYVPDEELLACYTRTTTLTQARCTQCQRYIPDTWHQTTPAPTYVLCPECTHMRTTAHARAIQALDNQVRALINRQLTECTCNVDNGLPCDRHTDT